MRAIFSLAYLKLGKINAANTPSINARKNNYIPPSNKKTVQRICTAQ